MHQSARLRILAAAIALAAAYPASASLVPLDQERSVEVALAAQADCAFTSCLPIDVSDEDSASAPDFGPFDATVGFDAIPGCSVLCGSGEAGATQISRIGSDHINVSAVVDAHATQVIGDTSGGNPLVSDVQASAVSRARVRFSIASARTFALSGSFAAQLAGSTTGPAIVRVDLWEGDAGVGIPLVSAGASCHFSCAETPFTRSGSLEAGVYTLEVIAEVDDGVGGWGPGDVDPDSFDAAAQLDAAFALGPDPLAVPVPGAWGPAAAAGVLATARRRLRGAA